MNKYNICALFSGCGGLDYGFVLFNEDLKKQNKEKLYRLIWANDFEKNACRSYSKNFFIELKETDYKSDSDIIYCGDITKVNFKKLSKNKIDLILGGFPCQDFSVLRGDRENKGIKVKRGRLYLEYVRALYTLEPKLFVAENVAGLVSANKGDAYKKILEDFSNISSAWEEISHEHTLLNNGIKHKEDLKYHILFSKVIDFSRLGVPQKRKRLIIIGLRKDLEAKLTQEKKLKPLEKKIDQYLMGYNSIFKKYPLTPIEVFEGRTLENLNEVYLKIMNPFEDKIRNINSERQKTYVKDIWRKYNFNIITDYMNICNNNIYNNKKTNKNSKKAFLSFDKWLKDEDQDNFSTGSKNVRNQFFSTGDIDIDSIMKAHQGILEELGYYNNPVQNYTYSDSTQELMNEQPHVIERMAHIPPNENFKFVWGTKYQVKGLMSNIYRRIHPLITAHTVIGKGGGGTWGYHYNKGRQRLTNRERARLQTFPDDFQFCGTFSDIRIQLGNAVPPLAGKRIAKIVYHILENVQ